MESGTTVGSGARLNITDGVRCDMQTVDVPVAQQDVPNDEAVSSDTGQWAGGRFYSTP